MGERAGRRSPGGLRPFLSYVVIPVMTSTSSDDRIADTGAETTADLDTAVVEEFGGRLIGVINDACIGLLVSIGHQTGLFETLAELPPATSTQIADAGGLNERYVREWLGGMTTAKIVVRDPVTATYQLPREHEASLIRAAGPDNLARLAQYIAVLGDVEQQIVGCFRTGGGVPYSAYPRFHRIMAEESAGVFDAVLVDGILPLLGGLPDRLRSGIDMADIGCGRGHAINLMGRAFPGSCFTGYDFATEAIDHARGEAALWGLPNVTFVRLDVTSLDAVDAYDAITAFDTIHDQAHPGEVLSNIHRALRPGGVFLMVDIKASSNVQDNIDVPWGSLLYTVSTMHCMTVSLALGGDGLGTVWGEQLALTMLADAGFTGIETKDVETDPFNSYYIARKG